MTDPGPDPVPLTVLGPGPQWWAWWPDLPDVLARGETEPGAVEALHARVPLPTQPGEPTAQVVTYERAGHGYAAYAADLTVVTTGADAEEATATLIAHVPVPQPTGGSSGDKPPKLEKKPLPPV